MAEDETKSSPKPKPKPQSSPKPKSKPTRKRAPSAVNKATKPKPATRPAPEKTAARTDASEKTEPESTSTQEPEPSALPDKILGDWVDDDQIVFRISQDASGLAVSAFHRRHGQRYPVTDVNWDGAALFWVLNFVSTGIVVHYQAALTPSGLQANWSNAVENHDELPPAMRGAGIALSGTDLLLRA